MRLLCPGQSVLASFRTANAANSTDGEAATPNIKASRPAIGSETQAFRILWSTEKTLYVIPKKKSH